MSISEKFRSLNFYLHLFCWVVLILCIFSTFATFNRNHYHMMFSSDAVGLHVIYNDLFLDGGQIKDWILASAPTLFPDIFLYMLVRKCTAWDIQNISMLYFFIQALLAIACCTYLFSKVVPAHLKKFSWLVPLLFTTMFIETHYFSYDITFAFYLSYFSYHGGSFINFIIVLCIYFSSMRDLFKIPLLFIFTAIAMFSDMLFLVLIVPFLLSIFIGRQFASFKRAVLLFLLLVIGGILGYKCYDHILTGGYATFLQARMLNPDNALPSLQMFLSEMYDFMKTPGFRSAQMFLTFLLIPYGFYYFLKNRKATDSKLASMFLLYSLYSLCVFSAPIVNGNFLGYDTLRYSVSPFYFALIMLACLIANGLSKISKEKVRTGISFALPSVLLCFFIGGFTFKGLNGFLNYMPPEAKEIDEASVKYGLTRGVADYWQAKENTIFSKKGIKIVAVYPNVYMNEMLSNINWYYAGPYNFIIEERIDRAAIAKELQVTDTINTENLIIYKVKPFVFERGKYFPVQLYPDTLTAKK
jgi:hypothetical protein